MIARGEVWWADLAEPVGSDPRYRRPRARARDLTLLFLTPLFAPLPNGAFDLVVSPQLLAELRRALGHSKLARLVPPADADALVELLGRVAEVAVDPPGPPPVRSADPKDDYLVALAAAERAVIVSGDAHLTVLADRIPVRRPAEFLAEVEAAD